MGGFSPSTTVPLIPPTSNNKSPARQSGPPATLLTMSHDTPPSSNTLSGPIVLGAVAATGAALGLGYYLSRQGKLHYWGLDRHTRKRGLKQGEAGGIGSGRFPRNPAPGVGAPLGGIDVHPSCYPWGRREEKCQDLVHGVCVPDPYRSVPRRM